MSIEENQEKKEKSREEPTTKESRGKRVLVGSLVLLTGAAAVGLTLHNSKQNQRNPAEQLPENSGAESQGANNPGGPEGTSGTRVNSVHFGAHPAPIGDHKKLPQGAADSGLVPTRGSGAADPAEQPSALLPQDGSVQAESSPLSREHPQGDAQQGAGDSSDRNEAGWATLSNQIIFPNDFGSSPETPSAASSGDEDQVQQLINQQKSSAGARPSRQRMQVPVQTGAVEPGAPGDLEEDLRSINDRPAPVTPLSVSRLDTPELRFPQTQELQDIPRFDNKPIKGIPAPAKPARKLTPEQKKQREEKMLAKIKTELGAPAPKEQLKDGLYDPWAEEYESIVSEEEERITREARAALKARQEEEKLRKKTKQVVGN